VAPGALLLICYAPLSTVGTSAASGQDSGVLLRFDHISKKERKTVEDRTRLCTL